MREREVDRALIEAARSGDEEAFDSIARGMADRLFSVAHRILRDVGLAEDAVQQTLVTAWRELPGLREVERSRRGSTGSSSTPATPKPVQLGVGRRMSGSCRSTDR